MSVETDLRAVLIGYAPLTSVVPAVRISIDAVEQGAPRPYIAFAKQSQQRELGLSNALLGAITAIDIQCVGASRKQSLEIQGLVYDALAAYGQPAESGGAGYDADNDLEVEVVSVSWVTG